MIDNVMDLRGNKHYILDRIGSDGQGVLHATKNNNILVRTARTSPGHKESSDDRYENVKILPLSDENSVDKLLMPIDFLNEPNVGYVLNIPEGFIPLSSLMNEQKISYKQRFGILSEVAKILIKLHSMPIMYGSMSPLRIFVSPKEHIAYLLYSSKMDYTMRFKEETDDDPYIAPETANGQGGTLASDSYAFGALSYDLLTHGDTILAPELKEMLAKTQKEPENRPKIYEFHKMFMQQADQILTCKKCQADFFYDVTECPKCAAPLPKMLKATIYDTVLGTNVSRGLKILEFASQRQCFYNYHTETILMDDPIVPSIDCVLNITEGRKLNLIFKNLMKKEITLNEKPVAAGQATVVPLPCEFIRITVPLHTKEVCRCIDMVMV